MGAETKIEWCHHTFNPWIGCTEVSPACDHCYARAMAHRRQWAEWGNHPRHRTSRGNWRQPLKWNAAAIAAGERRRVFCASLADVFDNQVPNDWRRDLATLIDETPQLDWLLLTKRPQNAYRMLGRMFSPPGFTEYQPRPNVWLGTTVENQDEADRRIPVLCELEAVVRFLSIEPLLGPVHLDRRYLPRVGHRLEKPAIGWVIVGGESGPGARPMHPQWARHIQEQCADADVPFLFKQWGNYVPDGQQLANGRTVRTASDAAEFVRVKKEDAGRMLDGREWNEFPKVAA